VPLDADAQVKPRISISLSYEYDASFWDQSHHLAQVDKQTTPSPHKPSASPIKTPSKSEAAKRAREKRQFIANRETLASAFLARFLAVMCDSDKERRMLTLAEPISIIWNKTLNTTAGRATYRRSSHFAFIELSTKVIDCEARLEATLAHELCHLLTWIVSDDFKQPHGRTFKAHAARTQRRMHIEVTTKHDYEIDHKYQWQCSADSCGRIFGRHSKSIDPSKVCCGICRGMLVQIKPKPRSVVVNPETPRSVKNGLTKYKAFLMDRMADVQKMNPDLCYAERVKMIAAEYRVSKQREEGSVKMPDLASLSLT
jgi:predicted SprT family Zn-dependent metalloprotease